MTNGHVQLGSGPDPAWQGRIGFAPEVTTIAAQGYAEVMMTVAVPLGLSPDLYFVGFLVSPVPTGKGDVEVINEIGAFVTLDVPGPRDNRLRAELRLPGFTLAKESVGRVEIDNVGRSAVRFWGENDSTAWPGSGTPHQQRFDKSLVPAGHVRSVAVAAKPAWWVGVVTMQVRVIYPATTEAATKEIAFRKRVLVVDPRALVVCGGVLGVAVVAWVRRRRRRRRRLAARARRRGPGTEPSQARRSVSKVGAS